VTGNLVAKLLESSQGACGFFVSKGKGSVTCHECERTRYRHTLREAAGTLENLLAERDALYAAKKLADDLVDKLVVERDSLQRQLSAVDGKGLA
jgi:hypothetical protein